MQPKFNYDTSTWRNYRRSYRLLKQRQITSGGYITHKPKANLVVIVNRTAIRVDVYANLAQGVFKSPWVEANEKDSRVGMDYEVWWNGYFWPRQFPMKAAGVSEGDTITLMPTESPQWKAFFSRHEDFHSVTMHFRGAYRDWCTYAGWYREWAKCFNPPSWPIFLQQKRAAFAMR